MINALISKNKINTSFPSIIKKKKKMFHCYSLNFLFPIMKDE